MPGSAEAASGAGRVTPRRYGERPADWRARLFGMSGTAFVAALLLGGALFGWQRFALPLPPSDPALVVQLEPLAAPAEPVEELPEGPRQIEQRARETKAQEQKPEPLDPIVAAAVPLPVRAETNAESAPPARPVPQTSAPKSMPAPPAPQIASDAEPRWEALLLAHLEKYRRYPPAARARRQQGTAFVRFRMNRQGRVLEAALLRSSGVPQLDRAALDTLRRAQPLPPIPEDRADPLELSVPVEFFVR